MTALTIASHPLQERWNGRRQAAVVCGTAAALLLAIGLGGTFLPAHWYGVSFPHANLAPSGARPFGSDWLGRDMLWRTIAGLSISLRIGLFASLLSSVVALLMGLSAAMLGGWWDRVVLWLVDLMQGMPHLIFMIFLAILVGRGMTGVMVGVAATHWVGLCRIVRAETLYLRTSPYVMASRQMGRSRWFIARKHYLPSVIPQTVVATVLLFPHAILHEAGLTFLGFGIPAHVPAVGVILSESMRYLMTGMWWLAVFPGVALMLMVLAVDRFGHALAALVSRHGLER